MLILTDLQAIPIYSVKQNDIYLPVNGKLVKYFRLSSHISYTPTVSIFLLSSNRLGLFTATNHLNELLPSFV